MPPGRLWRVCGVNSPAVKPGDTVTAGQKLGTVGTISCECAEEAHIHLEVLQNGQYLDPAKISWNGQNGPAAHFRSGAFCIRFRTFL